VAGLDVIDGVYLDLQDAEGFAAICEQGCALGFDGKSLIHPNQIAVANRVFAPDAEAVNQAQRLLACWLEAEKAGEGVAVLDGKLVENLHAAEAERILALAEAITRRDST
jgi:citrate lyase subunit beta/citryl-CoA lyase